VARRGPLLVTSGEPAVARAFRNVPGVEVASVDRLNLLQLAPGGHLGRFVIWTKPALQKLDAIFGERRVFLSSLLSCLLPSFLFSFIHVHALCSSDVPSFFSFVRWCCAVEPCPVVSASPAPAPALHTPFTHPTPQTPTPPAGTTDAPSLVKKGFHLPRPLIANGDLARLINSDELQASLAGAPRLLLGPAFRAAFRAATG
jgi:hypothetical protein